MANQYSQNVQRSYALSLKDVTNALSIITGSSNFHAPRFRRAYNLIRGRIFYLTLSNHNTISETVVDEELYRYNLEALLLKVVTSSLWRTALNSYHYLKHQEKLIRSRDSSVETIPQQKLITEMIASKLNEFKCTKWIDEHLRDFERVIDLKIKAADVRHNILQRKGHFIDQRQNYDPQIERKKGIMRKKIQMLSLINLQLINHACLENHELLKNDELRKIKIEACVNLNKYL